MSRAPNILFIMSDDHASHAMSCYASRINRTPQLDRIAAGGLRFDNCFCTNSICTPSRATILTGTYNHVNGVTTLATMMDNRLQTFPKLLQAAGYQTAHVGKWHLGQGPAHWPTGFDYWTVFPGQGRYFDPEMVEMTQPRVIPGYATDIVTDHSLRWLRQRDPSRPFLLMCHHKAPHRPWDQHPRHAHRYADEEIPYPETFDDDYAHRARAAAAAEMRIESDFVAGDVKVAPPEPDHPDRRLDAGGGWRGQPDPRHSGSMSSRPGSDGAIVIGSRLEPLVDRFLIEETRGSVRLELGTPVERELVFVHDRPWEGNRSGLTTIIRDGAVCRMYYCGSQLDLHDGGYRIPHNYTCYAQSADGLAWSRPHLGLVDLPDGEPNNAILTGQPPLTFTPFLDANPDCAPDQRFKALALKYDPPPRALYGFASADGIHWSQIGDRPLITTGYFDSQNIAFWDATRGEYRAYVRDFHGTRDAAAREVAVRDVRTCTSPDFLAWTEPQWLSYEPERFAEIYTNQINSYYRAPHLFVGLPMRYVTGHGHVTELNERISRSQERFGTSYTDTALMTSRDGRTFDLWGEAFIRPGPVAKGRWHYGANGTALGMLETPGEGGTTELSLFVDEGGWDHPSRLRRYALRVDGFASLRAGAAGGEVLTRPLIFAGDRLVLNISTSALGWLRVEVRDREGRTLDGFAEDDCVEVFGDDIEHEVRWQGAPDLGRLAGTPVRLRFTMRDADLYSLRFRDGGAG